jgi:hypothetical protein
MFARPSSNAYVCLRCQSRLLHRRPNPPLVTSTQRFPFSAVHPRPSPPDGKEAGEASLPIPDIKNHVSEDGEQQIVQLSSKSSSTSGERRAVEHPFGRKPLGKGSWYVLGKVRGRPGGETREGSTALSIDSLGKPTEIIVLRDLGLEQGAKEEEDDIPFDKQDFSREAILRSIEDEKLQLDQATINVHIDKLRPSAPGGSHVIKAVTAAEYAKLGQKLDKGYTSAHLRGYCQAAVMQSGEQVREGSNEQTATIDKKISLIWSPWRPGTTPISKRPPEGTKPISLIRNWDAYNKQALVSIIMQSIWNIHIAAEEDSEIGELEVRLKPWEVDLFTAGSKAKIIGIREKALLTSLQNLLV